MPERRMFAKSIIDSDAFLEMPISAQCLYFHLSMRADDEGFIGNPRSIMRVVKASDDDMKLLIAKRFILIFDSGVIVIKHWKIHNYIQADRMKRTNYVEEKATLILDEKNAYTEKNKVCLANDGKPIANDGKPIANDDGMDTQVRLSKDSIDKDSINKVNLIEDKDYKEEETITFNLIKTFIEENKLENLSPMREFVEINDNQIKDWKEHLKEKNMGY